MSGAARMLATKLVTLSLAALFASAASEESCTHALSATSSSAYPISSVTPQQDPSTPFSTRMLSSIMLRQQGLVSSGQATSTLESGLITLAIQSWLSLYASPPSTTTQEQQLVHQGQDGLKANFSDYVDSILASLSTMASFTNLTQTALLPLDRLTVAQ